jgi:hypothetical protein
MNVEMRPMSESDMKEDKMGILSLGMTIIFILLMVIGLIVLGIIECFYELACFALKNQSMIGAFVFISAALVLSGLIKMENVSIAMVISLVVCLVGKSLYVKWQNMPSPFSNW